MLYAQAKLLFAAYAKIKELPSDIYKLFSSKVAIAIYICRRRGD